MFQKSQNVTHRMSRDEGQGLSCGIAEQLLKSNSCATFYRASSAAAFEKYSIYRCKAIVFCGVKVKKADTKLRST